MQNQRFRILKDVKTKKGPILYWMSRDQRVKDNWALLYAQQTAIKNEQPLIVLFCLAQSFLVSLSRNLTFMLKGLQELEKDLSHLNISFVIIDGLASDIIPRFILDNEIGMIITDFSPLNVKASWIEDIISNIEIPFYEIDTHNIIPCWIASNKQEYAAYTFRPKVRKGLYVFLEEIPKMQMHPFKWSGTNVSNEFKRLISKYKNNEEFEEITWILPGEKEAKKVLDQFKATKFTQYHLNRNDPSIDGTSNLSAYLHFGQISSQRVVLELIKIRKILDLKNSFYDEIIVRKELSDNFCFYSPNYNNFNCFPNWARQTLNFHRTDQREYIYTLEELEKGETHDEIWNAAQNQMIRLGKMHGYMRMYWCKKILEWSNSPEEALKHAIYLNDKYEIDGRDPNGYVGIAWSIGGLHDRAWKERKIFGKVRYMSAGGLKRKFNIKIYIEKYSS